MNEFIARAVLTPAADAAFTEAQFLDALRPLWDALPDNGLRSALMDQRTASWFMCKWGKMNHALVRDHYRRAALAREAQHR